MKILKFDTWSWRIVIHTLLVVVSIVVIFLEGIHPLTYCQEFTLSIYLQKFTKILYKDVFVILVI